MEVAKEEIPKATEDITAPKMHTVRNPYAFAKAETNGPEMYEITISGLSLNQIHQRMKPFPGAKYYVCNR